jgi:hypothetical protein
VKPYGILRRIVVVNMRFVTLRYKFTKKQWIYWISWIPDQSFWSLDMAWSQTRTIRSKADRNFNPTRKFRGKNIQNYVFKKKILQVMKYLNLPTFLHWLSENLYDFLILKTMYGSNYLCGILGQWDTGAPRRIWARQGP